MPTKEEVQQSIATNFKTATGENDKIRASQLRQTTNLMTDYIEQVGLPIGGDPGQIVALDSQGEKTWVDLPDGGGLPTGGEAGQFLGINEQGQPEWLIPPTGSGSNTPPFDLYSILTGTANRTVDFSTLPSAFNGSSGGNDVAFAFSAWVKRASGARLFIVNNSNTAGQGQRYGISGGTSGDFYFTLQSGEGDYIAMYCSTPIPADTWTHITASYDGSKSSSGIVVYVNGVSVSLSPLIGGTYAGLQGTGTLSLGKFVDWVGTNVITYGAANFSQFAFFNRALTSQEAASLYANDKSIDPRTLSVSSAIVGFWNFENSLADGSASASHTAVAATPTYILDSPETSNPSGGSISTVKYYIDAVADFGMGTSKTAAQNTTALNAAIAASSATGKPVIIAGKGVFLVNQINWDASVRVSGLGRAITTLKSASAVSMFVYGDSNLGYLSKGICAMTLDGNNIGTIGIETKSISYFDFEQLYITNFTQYGIKGLGMILGYFNNCFIYRCANGIYGGEAPGTVYDGATITMPSNITRFTGCDFQQIPGIVIDWNTAASLQFIGCDFELSGTTGNAATGVIKLRNMSPSLEGIDMKIDGCWFEVNKGGFVLDLGPSNGKTIIRDTLIQCFPASGGTSTYGIKNASKLFIDGSIVSGHSTDIQTTGASGKTITVYSTVTVHSENTGGVYNEQFPL